MGPCSNSSMARISLAELTSAVHFFAVGTAPGQLRDGNTYGAAAQQDVVAQGASHPGHGRVHPRALAPLQLRLGEKNPRQALRVSAPQPGVDKSHGRRGQLLKLDQIVQPAVTEPGVVV